MRSDILITGSTGFVGKNLLSYLSSFPFKIKPIDLRNSSEIPQGFHALVHLAGKAHDLKKVSAADEYYKVNYELTKTLYDQFLDSEADKFIFISSVKAAADRVDGVLTEEVIPQPLTDYGRSKLMAEDYIRSRQLPAGKSFYILRPCMIHGPGNKGNLNLLYKVVTKGLPWPLGSFENRRSFLSVHNLCFVINELISRDDIPSGTYNVADDQAISTNRLIRLISEEIGRPERIMKMNASLIRYLSRIGDKLKLPLNSERLQKLTESYEVSNQKIRSVLKKELPLTTEAGLRITLKAFSEKK